MLIKAVGPNAFSLIAPLQRDTFVYDGTPEPRTITTNSGEEVQVWLFQFDDLEPQFRLIVAMKIALERKLRISDVDAYLRRAGWTYPRAELELPPEAAQPEAEQAE